MSDPVRIEVLGELRAIDPDGAPIALPTSRKTAALLAYLALTGRQQFREHLCDLLWDEAEDPRGALRWSLSRLRAALDTDDDKRIESDRRTIGLRGHAYACDLHEAERVIESPDAPNVATLREVAGLFRGDLLDGLDLLGSFRFHTWCAGQREHARALRIKALRSLIAQTTDADEGLQHAHELVSVDPLNEEAHAEVIGLLTALRRPGDAQAQASSYLRILEMELGEAPPDVAARLRKLVHSDITAPIAVRTKRAPGPAIATLPMVGRAREMDILGSWSRGADQPTLALIAGEPGAGKTRLMTEATAELASDAIVIRGRAYRAENVRALGPWRDALSEIEGARTVLTAVGDGAAEPQDRTQLFDELLGLILAEAAVARCLVVELDDVQWLDEASAAFLHYVVRSQPQHVAVIGTLRPAELIDNPIVGDTLQSLRDQSSMLELTLEPLSRADIGALCASIGESIDVDQVVSRSEGNPFLATEIARALARGETELPSNTLHLVEARLRALSDSAREVLPWAAALGRTFHVDVLQRVTGLSAIALVERVGELEERGVFEPRETGAYDFVHDFVRDAAYRQLSAPRRRIIHRSIARSLDSDSDGQLSPSELLRHAELAGEDAIACRASAAAARDALDVCGWIDACRIADRGLHYSKSLDDDERIPTTLGLLDARIAAASVLGREHPDQVGRALSEVIERGGSAEQKSHALYLRAVTHWDHSQSERAATDIVASADASRHGDPETAARQIANSARCLLYVERDVATARSLLGEAQRALESMNAEDVELFWAEALMARWDGDLDAAAASLLEAIRVAKATNNHWRQSACLTSLMMVASEAGDADRVQELARGGLLYDEENDEPLKSPFVLALAGIADVARDPTNRTRLDAATETLRERGATAQLSYVLAETARLHAGTNHLAAAEVAADEAIQLGERARRLAPRIDALVTLAWAAAQRGDKAAGLDLLDRAESLAADPDAVTARVRRRLQTVADSLRRGDLP